MTSGRRTPGAGGTSTSTDPVLKRCKWKDHQWVLKEYVVDDSTQKVWQRFLCKVCGMIKHDKLGD
jgi:hypothetical protein